MTTDRDGSTRVLFVCVRNSGKSQLAAGLMRSVAGPTTEIASAGTDPGPALNQLSVAALAELGIDISSIRPRRLTDDLIAWADVVVLLGREVQVAASPGTRHERWETDEPSERGIDGLPRMRLIRDDIAARVGDLVERLGSPAPPGPPLD